MGRLPEKESLVDIFRWRVKESSESIVSKYKDRLLTYKEYDSNANKVAQGIINEGCKPNGRVAFLAKNSDQFFEFLYGTMKSRTVAVGINWRLAPPEVSYVINDSKSEILFVGKEFYPIIREIINEIPTIKKIISMDGESEWEHYIFWRDKFEAIDPFLESNIEDDVIQLYTSGTTGYPKGVQLTNKNFIKSNLMVEKTWGKDWHEGSANIICSPVF